MPDEFDRFLATAQGIAMLLYPYAEVVLHDLSTRTIAAIFNNYSQRKPGDDSLLEEIEFDESKDVIGPYEKLNWDGRKLKSITVVIRNTTSKAVGLMCINLDVSKFEDFQRLIEQFIRPNNLIPQPEELFKDDWQERINVYIHDRLRQQHKHLNTLSRIEKRELVKLLDREGAFKQKNAATYIGKVLKISRATVYKYLSDS
jgi:D-arginine utilization repressor